MRVFKVLRDTAASILADDEHKPDKPDKVP